MSEKKFQKTREIEEKYDQTAEHYETRYNSIQELKYSRVFKDLNEFKNDKRIDFQFPLILDAGCGTGLLLTYLDECKPFEDFVYVGMDISLNMLGIAIKKGKKNCKGNFLHATVDHVPFRNGMFDFVASITTLQNLDKHQYLGFFNEIADSLTKNGISCLSFLEKPPLSNLIEKIINILERLYLRVFFQKWPELEDSAIFCENPK
ncbi:MAG: class I SAM-dependent methyltransferase [Candidatus Hodarchaeota archaeon]